MIELRLGNPNPQQQVRQPDGSTVSQPHPILNQSVTSVEFWDGIEDAELVEHTLSTDNDRFLSMIARGLQGADRKYAIVLRELEQFLPVHMAGAKPAWVVCEDDPELQRVVADYYGCHSGEPVNLLTNNGRDDLHKQHMTTGSQPAAYNYIALTANSTAPSASDTTLTGEITTGGGGLVRAQATFAHTNGTNTSTLTKTFTANGSDSLSVVIAKIGVFNASSSGTMGYETLLNATDTLTVSGDSLTVTDTITGG